MTRRTSHVKGIPDSWTAYRLKGITYLYYDDGFITSAGQKDQLLVQTNGTI